MWFKNTFLSLLFVGGLLESSSVQGIFRKDYTYIEKTHAYYKYHSTVKNWTNAYAECALEGAKLFYPENEQEATEVRRSFAFSWIFIGISDLVVEGVYESVDGISIRDVYTKWREGEPNNAGGLENCITLLGDGTFNDDSCDKSTTFICKKNQRPLDWNKPCRTPNMVAPEDGIFFRDDYTFLESTQAFYKFHSLTANWMDANRTCDLEGAKFFYPENEDEMYAVTSFWNDTQWSQSVFVGISNLKGVAETVDGLQIEEVANEWLGTIPISIANCLNLHKTGVFSEQPCTKKYNFICKKNLRSVDFHKACNMPNLGYTYDEVQGKCYKFHNNAVSWVDAYKACNSEQSYLAVINSENERDMIIQKVMQSGTTKIPPNGTIHLGFHKRIGRGWRTVKGTTLYNSGYERWAKGQPDGHSLGVAEKCGAMSYTGLLHDIDCYKTSFFVCEHDICSRFSQV